MCGMHVTTLSKDSIEGLSSIQSIQLNETSFLFFGPGSRCLSELQLDRGCPIHMIQCETNDVIRACSSQPWKTA